MKKILLAPAALLVVCGTLSAGVVSYTCDATVSTDICSYLNTTVAGAYNGTFTNANAQIYIAFGSTSLGASTQAYNYVSYDTYKSFLTTNASDSLQHSAVTSLSNDTTPYGSGNVEITAALGTAMGIGAASLNGVNAAGTLACPLSSAGCYDGTVVISNTQPLYYDYLGGSEPSNAYDFLSVVQHETDEVLGTSSCMSTQSGGVLSDPCSGAGTPAAIDLFRYNSLNNLALNSTYAGLSAATVGAYFSYNGGATNGANGFTYNVAANGNDYADFVNSCPAGPFSVQDAQGCPGHDAGLSIISDGGAEINMLNAVGYDLAAPEPGTMGLFAVAFAVFAAHKSRRRA